MKLYTQNIAGIKINQAVFNSNSAATTSSIGISHIRFLEKLTRLKDDSMLFVSVYKKLMAILKGKGKKNFKYDN